jgi:hypothetical protein
VLSYPCNIFVLRLTQSDIPPNADVLEVRDTLTLPFGRVSLEGRTFLLMPAEKCESLHFTRKLAVTDVHPRGQFNRPQFADPTLGGFALSSKSKILQPKHIPGLIRVCGGRPQLEELLYSSSRDGYNAADFHRLCDNRGPTMIFIHSSHHFVVGGELRHRWH